MTRNAVIEMMELLVLEFDDFSISDALLDLWEKSLADISNELGDLAARVVILKSPHKPRIADIRGEALRLMNPESEIDAGHAWSLVLKAVRLYGSYQAARALESLPATVAEAARRVGWVEICTGDEMANRAHFLKIFEAMQGREKEIGVLPPALQDRMRQAALQAGPVSATSMRALADKCVKALAGIDEMIPPALPQAAMAPPVNTDNVRPFRRVAAQSRTPQELADQARILRGGMSQESQARAEFAAMTEEERATKQREQAAKIMKEVAA